MYQYEFQSIAYLLPEGQVEWRTGIAVINDEDLIFTWCTRSIFSSRYMLKSHKIPPFSSHNIIFFQSYAEILSHDEFLHFLSLGKRKGESDVSIQKIRPNPNLYVIMMMFIGIIHLR